MQSIKLSYTIEGAEYGPFRAMASKNTRGEILIRDTLGLFAIASGSELILLGRWANNKGTKEFKIERA